MNPEVAIDIFKTTVLFALYTAAPFLIAMMIVGLLTSLFQAVTGLQEATLTFAPKLIAFAALSMLLSPWLLRTLAEFTVSIFTRMSTLAH
jgi:flagellar biosynthesis protein FliQ